MAQLLIVDDEPSICWGLAQLGQGLGHGVDCAASAQQGLELAAQRRPDAVFLDVRLPGRDGLSAMPDYRVATAGAPIIVMTAFGDMQTAARAVELHAFDYLIKPFRLDQAEQVLQRALGATAPGRPSEQLPQPADGLVGRSAAMQEVFKQTALVAASEACVLIEGETGTGKELIARAIHRYSSRRDQPFVPVNLAALSPTLVESELFGHAAGAYTGASTGRRGLLEQAHRGTLFLDEVGEIPPALQVKLLRVIEYGEYLPVGADEPKQVDLRLVAATHRCLEDGIACGEFRRDFFFRLSTIRLTLPPLRQRTEDIPLLAQHFLHQWADRAGLAPPAIAAPALQELERRTWQGNVRELAHAIHHALVMSRGATIGPEHLPPPLVDFGDAGSAGTADVAWAVRNWARRAASDASAETPLYERLRREFEPALFEEVLHRHGGQLAPAARELGLHRMTLRKRLRELGIRPAPDADSRQT